MAHQPSRGHATAPFVEPLEDRCVPATPVLGAVELNPGTQVALALTGPTSSGPDSSRVSLSGDTAALGRNNAELLLAQRAPLPQPGEALPGPAGQPPAGAVRANPFATTLPQAFVSAFGPQEQDGVVVIPATPDQAAIGFPGRIVLPGTNSLQRANLFHGPFTQEPGSFTRGGGDVVPEATVVALAEQPRALTAAEEVAWLDEGERPDVPPKAVPAADEGEAPPEKE